MPFTTQESTASGSRRTQTNAAGPFPSLHPVLKDMELPQEPFVAGKISTLPLKFCPRRGCRRPITSPVAGSYSVRKQSGTGLTTAIPAAFPPTTPLPAMMMVCI
jgi:hypothetical protein